MSAGPMLVQPLHSGEWLDDRDARALNAEIMALEASVRRSFIRMGELCLQMKTRSLWAKLCTPEGIPFHSWEHWATCTLDVCRRSAFAAVKVIEATKGIPIEDLQQMSRRNVQHFARLSTQVQAEVVEKAKTLPEKEFVALIQKDHPQQHIEARVKKVLEFDDSALAKIAVGMEQIMEMEQLESWEQAIEFLVQDYADNHRGE